MYYLVFSCLQVAIQILVCFSRVCFNAKYNLFNVLFDGNESGYSFINALAVILEEK